MQVTVTGLEKMHSAAGKIGRLLRTEAMELKVVALAREAGYKLESAAVAKCLEMIYISDSDYEVTDGLINAHMIREQDHGKTQIITIDPDAVAEGSDSPRINRYLVNDAEGNYASRVHEGYEQWAWGYDTGVAVPGRPWFSETEKEMLPIILDFIQVSYFLLVAEAMAEAVG